MSQESMKARRRGRNEVRYGNEHVKPRGFKTFTFRELLDPLT
jgi:hypothetical protein